VRGAPLRFGRGRRFRIVQLTDTHFTRPCPRDRRTRALIEQVLDAERPDLVVLTGDVVSGAESPDPAAAWREAVAPIVARGLRWAAVFGNHDDEGSLDRAALLAVQRACGGCLTAPGPKGIGGVGNYVLPVFGGGSDAGGTRGSVGARRSRTHGRTGPTPAALLYFLDSGSYTPTGAGQYAWLTHEQVSWYRRTSASWARRAGATLPALALFHIPLPEYETAWREGYDKRGSRHEVVCAPAINSGMFAAFHERGDVVGTFCGHDHANDFEATLHGIRLCCGRATGYGGYGQRSFPRGARIIELREGERTFRTWVRPADSF